MRLDLAIAHDVAGFRLDVAFRAPAGVTALFGPSGAGKTTIINAVAGLLRPHRGHITLDGDTLLDTSRGLMVPPHRRRIACVFQDARLFPHLSVRQNLLFATRFHRGAPADLAALVDLLGIAHLLDRAPRTLSGGETGRVAIGRALMSAPRLLLLDEPLAALDTARKGELLPYLERLSASARVPILYVSHAMAEVTRLATTLVVLDHGRVVRAGPIEEVLPDPVLGPDSGGLLSATVQERAPDGLTRLTTGDGTLFVALPPTPSTPPGTRLRIRLRASDVILAREPPRAISALNILPVRITALRDTPLGVAALLSCGDQRLAATLTHRSALALGLTPGLECHAIVKSAAIGDAL